MKLRLFTSLSIVTLLWSCGGEDQANHVTDKEKLQKEELKEEPSGNEINEMADFKFHTMIANLPSPLQTFQIIDQVDLEMSSIILTPLDRAGNLSTGSARAYGYGVYITDMGFMAYGRQNQQTLDYFQVCRDLASKLGAGDVFDRTITQDFEENTSSEEQFVKMMDRAFTAMDQYMVDNDRFVNATEIFVGSWVESQIIATQILQGKPLSESNRAIYEGIYAQKQHASNLMNVLGEIDQEVEQEVFVSVEDLMMFYAGFSSVENINDEDLAELEQKLNTLKDQLLG
ncbi:MAG: hypothetical protein WEC59_09750 [Salibacteraceae bacterium]